MEEKQSVLAEEYVNFLTLHAIPKAMTLAQNLRRPHVAVTCRKQNASSSVVVVIDVSDHWILDKLTFDYCTSQL